MVRGDSQRARLLRLGAVAGQLRRFRHRPSPRCGRLDRVRARHADHRRSRSLSGSRRAGHQANRRDAVRRQADGPGRSLEPPSPRRAGSHAAGEGRERGRSAECSRAMRQRHSLRSSDIRPPATRAKRFALTSVGSIFLSANKPRGPGRARALHRRRSAHLDRGVLPSVPGAGDLRQCSARRGCACECLRE